MNKKLSIAMLLAASSVFAAPAFAATDADCTGLPTSTQLATALKAVLPLKAGGILSDSSVSLQGVGGTGANGGMDLPMWATVMNKHGRVCAVATSSISGGTRAWPLSRAISAQKANTANGLSSNTGAFSSAMAYAAVQPGASLYGLQHSNPVNPIVAYRGDASTMGTDTDPMIGLRVGGVNVFGGGLTLYSAGKLVGAVGVSGDTSCADHNIAWALRKQLSMNGTPTDDNITYNTNSSLPFNGHAQCGGLTQPDAP